MMASPRSFFRRNRIARTQRWALATAVAVAVVVCATLFARRSAEQRVGLAAGAAFVDSLVARSSTAEQPRDISFGDAVALGYLERQRLGLGSPFRLAEYALHDPRLDSTARRRVAVALVGRALGGRGYAIDPLALAGVGPSASADTSDIALQRGTRHLALIERAIVGGGDPRVGELAVRLAYSLAAAERSVDRNAIAVVAPVAALVRDRQAAISDARRLLRTARAAAVDPLVLLTTWRRERRFAVERPTAELLDEALEVEAMARAPALLDSVRTIAALTSGDTIDPGGVTPPSMAATAASILGHVAASRLAVGVARYAPPQAPIVTAVRHYGPALLAAPGPAPVS